MLPVKQNSKIIQDGKEENINYVKKSPERNWIKLDRACNLSGHILERLGMHTI